MKLLKSKIRFLLTLVILTIVIVSPCECKKTTSLAPGWPVVTRESKPWSPWWWMGSGVTPADLKAAMEAYAGAGLGGLEITPIYGVHGYKDRFIRFLSPEWVEIFKYTLTEGQRLDLGIDLAMASGWPFGGLWVTPDDACKTMEFRVYNLKGGEKLTEKVSNFQVSRIYFIMIFKSCILH